jgi:hypothetical protein
MAFSLSGEQRNFIETILGSTYNGGNFDYDNVRIYYTAVPEQTLRNEIDSIRNHQNANTLTQLTLSQENALIQTVLADMRNQHMAMSLPGGRVYFPAGLGNDLPLLTHEVFHQFQYMAEGNESVFAKLVNEAAVAAITGQSAYDYSQHNRGYINILKDVTNYESQADVVQDFTKGYVSGFNQQFGTGYSTKYLAEILYKSGFMTRAVNIVRGWR